MTTMQKQVALRFQREPLQIPYPPGFQGAKSTHPEEEEFFLSTEPRFLTLDEIQITQAFLSRLGYRQELTFTGAVLVDPNDPLLQASHEQINQIEAEARQPSTEMAPGGGRRGVRERVYILRERGFLGSGNKVLNAAK